MAQVRSNESTRTYKTFGNAVTAIEQSDFYDAGSIDYAIASSGGRFFPIVFLKQSSMHLAFHDASKGFQVRRS